MGLPVSSDVDDSDNGDDDADADLRRLSENLSRLCPIFRNGRAITDAWQAGTLLHPHAARRMLNCARQSGRETPSFPATGQENERARAREREREDGV